MDINHLRKIGKRLKEEICHNLKDLRMAGPLGRGAGGDMTHPVDKLAEEIIFEEAEKARRPLTIVSEEYGTMDIKGGGPRLLVDPIDGSRNALSGIPLFSTSMALIDGETIGETSIGYVINLVSGDEFWATRGGGCFNNGAPARTQREDSFGVIAYEAQTPGVDIPRIVPLLSLFNRVRCFGSTALDLAFLAQGALSMFIVPSQSRSFDFAAGWLLVKEAGGIITDTSGGGVEGVRAGIERSTPLLASGNEKLHRRALDVLRRG